MSRSKSILVVDDEDNDAILIKRALVKANVRAGFNRVKDGEEAIRYFKGEKPYDDLSSHPIPSVVVLDLKMPRRTGFEVLSWMRQHQRTSLIPVVVFTSSRGKQDINRAYELGANAYMVKPNSFEDLIVVMKTIHSYWLELCVTADGVISKPNGKEK